MRVEVSERQWLVLQYALGVYREHLSPEGFDWDHVTVWNQRAEPEPTPSEVDEFARHVGVRVTGEYTLAATAGTADEQTEELLVSARRGDGTPDLPSGTNTRGCPTTPADLRASRGVRLRQTARRRDGDEQRVGVRVTARETPARAEVALSDTAVQSNGGTR